MNLSSVGSLAPQFAQLYPGTLTGVGAGASRLPGLSSSPYGVRVDRVELSAIVVSVSKTVVSVSPGGPIQSQVDELQSAPSALESLRAVVEAEVASGGLSERAGDFLGRIFDRVAKLVDHGRPGRAIHRLGHLVDRIEHAVDKGRLSPEVGQRLVEAVDALIGELDAAPTKAGGVFEKIAATIRGLVEDGILPPEFGERIERVLGHLTRFLGAARNDHEANKHPEHLGPDALGGGKPFDEIQKGIGQLTGGGASLEESTEAVVVGEVGADEDIESEADHDGDERIEIDDEHSSAQPVTESAGALMFFAEIRMGYVSTSVS